MLFTSQTMLGKAKRLIESFWVKSSNWSKLMKHRTIVEWGWCRKVCVKREVMCKRYLP